MASIETLKATARKAQNEIYKIELAERQQQSEKLVGKTFKYRNNYSCPEKPSDYFWLYLKVKKVSRDGHLICEEFQTDKYGDISIRFERHQYNHLSGYISITPAEYRRAFKAMQAKITKVHP
jgi:hypothetical protein